MGGYNDLKTAIAALIRTNDNQEITGATLQSALLSIINTIGQGSVFKGAATTSTNPGSPDANVFYIAGRPGYYPNFNLELTAGLHVIENKSGTWVNTEIALDVVDAINIGGAKHVKPSQAMLINLQSIEQIPDSEGRNNAMWWSTDGNLKYKQNDTVYNLGAPAYVLYYCGDKIYKWTGSGFREIGGGGTFASGEAVSNMSIFDDGSDTDGKSSAQLAAMIPSGEVIKSLLEIISSIETSGGSYDGIDLITTFSYDAPTRVITVKQSGRQAKTILLPLANSTNAGLMSSEDKTQLASLQNLIGKTVKSFNKSTGENGITITLTTYDDTPYTVLIPDSEIDPSALAGKADKHVAADILAPSQWPRVMLYNIESMWGAGGTPPDYASIPVGSIYLDEPDSANDPPYKRLFYKKTLEGASQRIDLGAPQENTIYCHIATGKLYRWVPTQNGNDGAFQQVGGDLILPHIGQNGNWWIGPETDPNNDTGIKAQGPQGNCNITDASQLVTILVNDLTTGGAGNILSAEMGKALKVAITTLIDSMGEYCFPNGRPTLSFETPKWNVMQNLTNVDSDFSALRIDKDGELTIHLSPRTGYSIGSVVVMMGNVDVTTTYYTAATGTISIPQVTGDVEITATAVGVESLYAKPENLVFMLDGLSQGNNANAWTDLIGGVVFTPNGATKVAKGWSFDGVDDYMAGDANMPSFDPYTHTIEICISSELTNKSYYVFVDGGGQTIANYLYNYQNRDFFCFRGTAYTDSHDTKGGSLDFSGRNNGNGVNIVSYNGTAKGNSGGRINGNIKSATDLSNNSAASHPSIGARYKSSSSEYIDWFKGTIHAIRVYNTQLTLAEMLANQKVDNERFELGLTLPNS